MIQDNSNRESVFALLDCARLHGENSEPDHEVGDLQDLLVACWLVMSPEHAPLALRDRQVQNVLDWPDYASLLE